MKELLALAERAVRAGAAEALAVRRRGDFSVRMKRDRTPVTEADERSALAVAKILYHETGYQIRCEDLQAGWYTRDLVVGPGAPPTWLVDPLDGTVPFVTGGEPWAVCVALVRDGAIQLGTVYLPGRAELYRAARGGGAWCNGRRLHVSTTTRPEQAVVGVTTRNRRNASFYEWAIAQCPGRLRDVFTAGVKLVYVASGALDAALSRPGGATCEWDNAPGRIIVEEAGGVVTGFHGQDLTYLQPDPRNQAGCLAAATSELHTRLLGVTAGWPASHSKRG